MTNLIIKKDTCKVAVGEPTYFVSEKDFENLISNKELAHKIWESFGHDICIGCIGKDDGTGVYEESKFNPSDINQQVSVEGACFYERLSE